MTARQKKYTYSANGSQEEQEDDFHDHSLWHRRRRLTFKSRSFNVQVELKY